jgi:ATP-binding cassette subfamily F protein 3
MERVEAPEPEQKTIGFSFPKCARSSQIVLDLRGIEKSYGDKTVYRGVDFVASRGDRIALVGPNGAGKSTLLKIAAGVLEFQAGKRTLGDRVEAGYFAQHQAEALDLDRTVLDEMMAAATVENAPMVRGLLGAFLFSGDAVDKGVRVLSGGEKNRLALAKILLRPPNLLVMDEPTNHLDLDSREALEHALEAYEGCLLFISHDRYFINRLATKVFHVEAGTLTEYWGDYDDYVAKHAGEGKPGGDSNEVGAVEAEPVNKKRELKRQLAELVDRRSRATRKLKDSIGTLEKQIAASEARLSEIDGTLGDPSSYGDSAKIEALGRERALLASKLDPLLERWTEDQSKLETLLAEFDREERALTER